MLRNQALTSPSSQHEAAFEVQEFVDLKASVRDMIIELDNAAHRSSDPYNGPPVPVVAKVKTGRRGRPRHEINPDFLRHALEMGTQADITTAVHSSARTVWRCILEQRLRDPGVTPFTVEVDDNGGLTQVHHVQPRVDATLSDDALDRLVARTLQDFPNLGRSMIRGVLKSGGHDIPTKRITASYTRVHSTGGRFGRRAIHRHEYNVPGANPLWHHDGQHGLYTHSFVKF